MDTASTRISPPPSRSRPMQISLIVAVAANGVIGRDGDLPWRLSNDLRYFKSITMGKPIVMGRKTYESIGRPLPGRPNLVVSRNPDFSAEGIDVFSGVEAAIRGAESLGMEELMVIGGATLYEEAFGIADRVYLTEVHADVAGDTFFPALDMTSWGEVSRDPQTAGDWDEYDHTFVVLDRLITA